MDAEQVEQTDQRRPPSEPEAGSSTSNEAGGPRDARDSQALPARKSEADSPPTQPPLPRWKKLLYMAIGLLIAVAIITAASLYWLAARHYESTDDAFIDGSLSQVAAQVSGRVLQLGFNDNQDVAAGHILVELDPRDFQVRLAQARGQRANTAAQVTQMQAQIGLQQANIDQAIANLHVAEAEAASAEQDFVRYRSINPAAISRQQVGDSAATSRSAAAKVEANRQAVVASRAQLEASRAQLVGAQAQLAASDADVANAELQLSYTHVPAPVAGQATKRSVDVGNYITPGISLVTIVPREIWVTANFKESQTGDMHVGQQVEIRIDQYPGLKFQGRIDSFQNGTGSAFSTLPAENATGNYVKVVQRVPVKITFDPHPPGAPGDLRLSPGLSVTPRVRVR